MRPATDFPVGSRVITPLDEDAVIVSVDRDGLRASIRYREAMNPASDGASLPLRLLVPWRDGEPRPKPVRFG